MAWAFNASLPTTNTATLIQFNVVGGVAGDTVKINGTGLSYNATTGAMSGSITSIQLTNSSGTVQTIAIGTADPATAAARQLQATADVTQFLAHAKTTAANIAALGVTFNSFDLTNAVETTPGSVLTVPVFNSGTLAGYLKLTGTDLYANKPLANGDITTVELLTAGGASYGTPKTIDYSSASPGVTLAELVYGQGANFDLLFAALTSGDDTLTVQQAGGTIDAGLGNDVITGSAGVDTVDYKYATGKITVDLSHNSVTFTDPRTGKVSTQTLTGIENINGSKFSDSIVGNAGDNVLFGGYDGVNDSLNGGAGNDTYIVIEAAGTTGVSDAISDTAGTDTIISYASRDLGITTTIENLVLMGSAVDGKGNNLNNSITGNNLDNTLDGKVGADTMAGGLGNDTYTVDNAGDVIVETAGQGTDMVRASTNFALTAGANVENLRTTSDTGLAAINLTGSSSVNTITGNAGANILDGGASGGDGVTDTLNGLLGNDTYVLGSGSDIVNDTGGNDTITSSITRTLASYATIENLRLTGSSAANATGNALANTLVGNSAANVITGGGGNDTMTGGAGNDTFVWDANGNDIIADFRNTYLSVALNGSNVVSPTASTATASGSLAMNLAQNRLSLSLVSSGLDWNTTSTASNKVTAFAFYQGASGANGALTHDVLADTATYKTITPSTGAVRDTWTTANGLTSALATSILAGGHYLEVDTTQYNAPGAIRGQITAIAGSADTISVAGLNIGDFETIQELAVNSGTSVRLVRNTNSVQSSVTLNLTQEADLAASHFVFQTGATNDTLNGTAGNDDLFGAAGDDVLTGGAGVDRLFGEAGNDTLDGGTGNDRMFGGLGNDTFKVDALGDYINDTGGTDTILASINYAINTTALAGIENLGTTNAAGTAGLVLVGNGLANTITGNAGNNTIDGLGGADLMVGGAGNDVYFVDNLADAITDAAGLGTDTVKARISYTLGAGDSIEVLTTAAPLGAINLTGNALDQKVIGNGSNNTINGGAGNDVLTGGSGNDNFLFNTALNATTNKDSITDFNPAYDTIQLDNAIFSTIPAGTLQAAKFYIGTAAHDADDRIIYNKTTGALSYDADGNGAGAAIQFAVLTNKANLTNADFFVV